MRLRLFPYLLLTIFTIWFYRNSLDTPIFHDEIAAYILPTLKLMANWEMLLPWKYDPKLLFGHPPLFYVVYGVALSVFPASLATIRVLSIMIFLINLFLLFEVTNYLKGKVAGLIALALGISFSFFWENGNLGYADNLQNTFFLLLLLAYFKKKLGLIFIWGCCLIFTRETAIIALFCLWLKTLFDYVKNQKALKRLRVFSALLVLQVGWFIFLLLKSGNATPVYNNEGFFFNLSFMSNTLEYILQETYITSGWIFLIGLVAIICVNNYQKFKVNLFEKYWFLPLIALLNVISLTTITHSLPRYQEMGILSLSIFTSLVLVEKIKQKNILSPSLFFILIFFIFLDNISIAYRDKDHGKVVGQIPEFYNCARRILDLDLEGDLYLGPFPLDSLVYGLNSLDKFKWIPELSKVVMHSLEEYPDAPKESQYIGIVFSSSNQKTDVLEKFRNDRSFRLLSEFKGKDGCWVFESE